MKKVLFIGGVLAAALVGKAQTAGFNPSYTENLFKYTDNQALNGTARYKGLSGAMGALGGDLSAIHSNPAGAAVFLGSEAALTASMNKQIESVGYNGTTFDNDYSDLNINQAGAVLVFDELNSDKWKSFSLAFNYLQTGYVKSDLNLKPENISSIQMPGNKLETYSIQEEGEASQSNVSLGANYDNRIYVGLGLNFDSFSHSNFQGLREYSASDDKSYQYIKSSYPNQTKAYGMSVNAGVIAKLNQNVRLGLAYESPKWYTGIEENIKDYSILKGTDSQGDYYFTAQQEYYYENNLTSSHKISASAAYVFGAKGLISAEYGYRDYSTAGFEPTNSFRGENDYIKSSMKGSNSFKIGGEYRLNAFTVRAGYRFESSPFEQMTLAFNPTDVTYKPFGDLQGYSVGLGYDFKGFFIDGSFDFSKRNRDLLLYGQFYDYGNNTGVDAQGFTADEAGQILSFNAIDRGYATSIKNIEQKLASFTITAGFRF